MDDDDRPSQQAQPGNTRAGGPLVSLADFQAADWEAPIRGGALVDVHGLDDRYFAARKAAAEDGDTGRELVFGLLAQACGIQLAPDQPGAPFEPAAMIGLHARSATASDYAGAQSEVFETLAPLTQNPGLRARLADIAWFNRRGAHASAALAIEAYREMVDGLAQGRFTPWLDRDPAASYDQVTYLHRALQIHRATAKDKTVPPALATTALGRYQAARDSGYLAIFVRLSRLMQAVELVAPAALAADAQAFALVNHARDDASARKDAYLLAADAWRAAGEAEHERDCRLKAVDLALEEVPVAAPALLHAHALRGAIADLRAVPRTRERRIQLEGLLRQAQAEARHDFTPIVHSTDITDIVSGTLAAFKDLPVPAALRKFAFISSLIDYEAERAEALQSVRRFSLQKVFGDVHLDRDGKVVAEGAALGLGGEPGEDWFLARLNRNMPMRRDMIVTAQIEPVRQTLAEQFSLSERHFGPVVFNSAFLPREQAAIFARGFARFFQGDYMSAAHLLLPQMESIVRHILSQCGRPTTIIQSDMTQEDRSLSAIFETQREDVMAVLGEAYTLEIDTLFLDRRGPALRHVAGHGKLTADQCYGGEVVYACWLMWRLACEPLAEVWTTAIAPRIEAQLP